jgi:hypothetical protein
MDEFDEQKSSADQPSADDFGWGEYFTELAADEDRVTLRDDGIEVGLLTPIDSRGEEISKILFKEPSIKQIKQLDRTKGDISKSVRLVMLSAGLSELDADSIKSRDFALIGKVITCFMGESPKAGRD